MVYEVKQKRVRDLHSVSCGRDGGICTGSTVVESHDH